MTRNPTWTKDQEDHLRALWESNTPQEIAEIMGRTRNAIIGKAYRIRLGDSRRSARTPIKAETTKAERSAPAPRVRAAVPIEGVSLFDVESDQCRAIIGSSDDGRNLAMMCGQPVKDGGHYPFCPKHYSLYTAPSRSSS